MNHSNSVKNYMVEDLKKLDIIEQKRRVLQPIANGTTNTAYAMGNKNNQDKSHTPMVPSNDVQMENRITKSLRSIQKVFDFDMLIDRNKKSPFVIQT